MDLVGAIRGRYTDRQCPCAGGPSENGLTLPTEPIGNEGVLRIIAEHLRPGQRVFVRVTAPIKPRIESAKEVCERVLGAARFILLDQLGTAFAKIRAQVLGTTLASEKLGLR